MADSAAKDFAYLQIASASGDVTAETSTWKGKRLRVKSAKPDFLQRLQAVWTDGEVEAEVLAERERAFSERYKGKRMLIADDGVVTIEASKAPVATVVVEAPQTEKEGADENDGHLSSKIPDDDNESDDEVGLVDAMDAVEAELSSETSNEDVDAPEDAAMSSETSEDEEGEQDDVAIDANEDEVLPADDIDMEAETERERELAYAQAQAASRSSKTDSEDNDEDVHMEAEIAKELEAASVKMTPAAPVVDAAARKKAANARRLAAIREREEQVAAMRKQPTLITATNKKITFGDDSDDSSYSQHLKLA
ncbi:hypothetical protein SPRG_11977 [Saprolegnia parasitica CBS 223.65]|uniref:Uncharacterized protein n=1 Tax=Saprolegnia parasitica (strain CBS 223.65) TaxID=695850 RepID=A0A067C146_SAPPC|nr:hypothetical protein SPRG_11977 [Saprolegnia parasitica CBS 223.65]KDO22840.1 hypothetical protein SPRG_11977 [Saprolegnia parasitica CBS 223.65]|eukprot:XP_012206397.1 hypothetical protein SPRG_11977 [Saprolegnia parasitica CBS 223.65]